MSLSKRKALVAGGTGLVGSKLVDVLAEDERYEKVILLTRRPLTVENPKLEVVQVDFDHLDKTTPSLSAHDYFCCLGTTGSLWKRARFRKVDYDYVLALARRAEQDPLCRQFLLITSWGANPSAFSYYSKVKGEIERDVSQLDISGVHIFRPPVILGKREQPRWGEGVAKAISDVVSFFMIGTRRRFMAIEDRQIAQAMHLVAQRQQRGTHVYSPKAMYRMCAEQETSERVS